MPRDLDLTLRSDTLAPPMNLRLSGMLVVAAVILTGCQIDLQHNLTEKDANDIYVLLTENGISAQKVKEEGGNEPTFMIQVSKQDAASAARLLSEYSLPRPKPATFEGITKNKSFVPTATEERAMMLEALAGEVSSALNKVDGVLEANAIVMIPARNDLSQPDQRPEPSASVFVKYRPNSEGAAPLDDASVRRFVATAVQDLKPENVTVLMSPAQPPSARMAEDRFQEILSIKVHASSAQNFKILIALVALVVIGLALFSAWTFMRTGSPAPARRPVARRE